MSWIYACDVGSTRQGNFAWVRLDSADPDAEPAASRSIRALTQALVTDLVADDPVALGFEAPLFIPVPTGVHNLSRGRGGERNRSWAAPVGGYVAALGLHQAAWVLRSVREFLILQGQNDLPGLTIDWGGWPPADGGLLLWEAFVSGDDVHSPDHRRDAATAASCFRANQDDLDGVNALDTEQPLSLVAAAALWSGWTTDLELLHEPVLVVMPEQRYEGPINDWIPADE